MVLTKVVIDSAACHRACLNTWVQIPGYKYMGENALKYKVILDPAKQMLNLLQLFLKLKLQFIQNTVLKALKTLNYLSLVK